MGTPAEEFGPYVVYEQLGLGGMATVHRAETKGIAGFSKQVALKRMLPSVASDASLVKSFIREARLASHLRHANVAQTYDLGKVGETYFIAMELVPGRNLREILKHCAAVVGPMPLPIALNIICQICDALDYAHNLCDETGSPLGIIHRDVSPSNIIVSEGGVVKLIDFGIAKASARSGMHTMSGTIKGKFGYMAPEYLMGSIDARADLFALGVISHELLANRPLFQGKDDMDTLYNVKDMPILPPSRVNPKVPPELDSVVMTALDRNPEERWQRASAIRQALATEIKRLGLIAHNAEVYAWIDQAFQQKTRKKAQFEEEDSDPIISISSGTAELPRPGVAAALAARGTPRHDVPDDFSGQDGIATLVKRGARLDEWNATTEPTRPAAPRADPLDRPIGGGGGDQGDWKVGTDVPTKSVRKSTPLPTARPSSPHVVPRKTPPQPQPLITTKDVAAHADQERTLREPDTMDSATFDDDAMTVAAAAHQDRESPLDDDDVRTIPPRAERASAPPAMDSLASTKPERPSSPPATRPERPSQPSSPSATRPERPSQPPGIAPKSDAQARTIMIASSDSSEQVVRPNPLMAMPLGGPSQPLALDGPSQVLPSPAGLAPVYTDPHQRTMIAESSREPMRAAPAGAFAIAAAPHEGGRPTPNPVSASPAPALAAAVGARTIPGAPPAPMPVSPSALAAHAVQGHVVSGARTAPRMPTPEAPLNDLDARGVRPAARKLLGATPPGGSPQSSPQNSIIQTRIEMSKRSSASNFLLALLVLIAAGGAAAVVYFALPYLT